MKEAVVVFTITIFAFVLARSHLTRSGFSPDDYFGRCTAWLLINCAAFTLGSYWLYAAISSAVIALYARKDSNPLALFCFLAFAVPSHVVVLPGVGPIDSLIEINYFRILSFFVLLPIAWNEYFASPVRTPHMRVPDLLVALFLIWTVGASVIDSGSFTISLRLTVYAITDVVLPYYVASRYVTKIDQFYDIAAAFVAALLVLALIAIFEFSRNWLLYEWVSHKWGQLIFSAFNLRGGNLRAGAQLSPISLGFSLVVGLGFAYLLRRVTEQKWQNSLIILALVAGLLSTISRGPWVGFAALVIGTAVIGPGKFKRLSLISVATGGIIIVLLSSPYGNSFISLLPWIGTSDSSTISFRENLLVDALVVILENPLFGDENYFLNPLLDRHAGESMLDIANQYLLIALPYGLPALFLFVLIIFSSLLRLIVNKGVRTGYHLVGPVRVTFGIIAAMAVIVGTTSMIGVMPIIFWVMVGLSSALFRMGQKDG